MFDSVQGAKFIINKRRQWPILATLVDNCVYFLLHNSIKHKVDLLLQVVV